MRTITNEESVRFDSIPERIMCSEQRLIIERALKAAEIQKCEAEGGESYITLARAHNDALDRFFSDGKRTESDIETAASYAKLSQELREKVQSSYASEMAEAVKPYERAFRLPEGERKAEIRKLLFDTPKTALDFSVARSVVRELLALHTVDRTTQRATGVRSL